MRRSHARFAPVFFAPSVVVLATLLLVSCGGGESTSDEAAPTAAEAASTEDASAAAAADPLADTGWRLVEIQSMDDAVGTSRPEDPSRYTLWLGADGSAALRLDCNRAHGSWSAEAAAGATSGSFEFGPLAATQALCPPPSLGEQISGQAEYIRSFLLQDGRLHLSLMADGGIWVWEPDPDHRFSTEPLPELEAAILRASPDYTREVVGDQPPSRYLHGSVDLDGDGRDEVFAYLLGPFFCGSGGCDLMLFRAGEDGYTLVSDFATSRLPVIVSAQRTSGWSDLYRPESGGGAEASWVRHTFDGTTYVEAERLPGEPEPEGARYLAGAYSFEDGVPLEPAG